MELLGSILGALGSIASLVSLTAFWKPEKTLLLRCALILILLLTTSSTYFSYKYYTVTKPETVRKNNQKALREAASEFIKNNSLETNYWDTGKNEGIVKSGLALLEIYKEVIPDTYNCVRADLQADIQFGQQHRDEGEQRKALETAANNIVTLLKTLAGGG